MNTTASTIADLNHIRRRLVEIDVNFSVDYQTRWALLDVLHIAIFLLFALKAQQIGMQGGFIWPIDIR